MFKKMTTKEKILKTIRKNGMTAEQIAKKLHEWPSIIEYDMQELLAEDKVEIVAKLNNKPCYCVK